MNSKHKKSNISAHILVAKTAKGLAENFYEALASKSDHFYSTNPDSKAWVAAAWPLFIAEARATLTGMLTTQMAEDLKEQIKDALIKDASLVRGRIGAIQVVQG